jgi:hypothetical protein
MLRRLHPAASRGGGSSRRNSVIQFVAFDLLAVDGNDISQPAVCASARTALERPARASRSRRCI